MIEIQMKKASGRREKPTKAERIGRRAPSERQGLMIVSTAKTSARTQGINQPPRGIHCFGSFMMSATIPSPRPNMMSTTAAPMAMAQNSRRRFAT